MVSSALIIPPFLFVVIIIVMAVDMRLKPWIDSISDALCRLRGMRSVGSRHIVPFVIGVISTCGTWKRTRIRRHGLNVVTNTRLRNTSALCGLVFWRRRTQSHVICGKGLWKQRSCVSVPLFRGAHQEMMFQVCGAGFRFVVSVMYTSGLGITSTMV